MAPPADLVGSILPSQPLPPLERIKVNEANASQVKPPTKSIHSDADLEYWKQSSAHRVIALFVSRLSEAAVGKPTRAGEAKSSSPGIQAVLQLLRQLDQWTTEIEPKQGPQRFGNLAFRDWGARLDERNEQLHRTLLQGREDLQAYIAELTAYLAESFGSFVRIDYGSGHEVTFIAWLAYLDRLGLFDDAGTSGSVASSSTAATVSSTDVEADLALAVFPLYLRVVWGLQDRYALEPAGSHGVWGLDDYQFIPYILGAAQLRNQDEYRTSWYAHPSHKPEKKRLAPQELLDFVPLRESPPFANLFTTSIARIHSLKTGPFFEHSPLLNDISGSVLNWKKMHSGMLKMWDNEVMGKRPVVQHFLFGGVAYRWEGPSTSERASVAPETGAVPAARAPTGGVMPRTAAPWASSTASLAQTTRPGGAIPGNNISNDVPGSLGTRTGGFRSTQDPTAAKMPPPTAAPWARK